MVTPQGLLNPDACVMRANQMPREKNEVFSSQQYKKLYRRLRQATAVDHYPNFGNYQPKSLMHIPPDTCIPPKRIVPNAYEEKMSALNNNKSRLYSQEAVNRGADVVSRRHAEISNGAVVSHVLPTNSNVFLVGDKHDIITAEPVLKNGLKLRGNGQDRNNNNSNNGSISALQRNLETGENTKDSINYSMDLNSADQYDDVFGSIKSINATIHNIEINSDPLVAYPNLGDSLDVDPVNTSHEYLNGDFSEYLEEDETDAAVNRYPVIRPPARSKMQQQFNDNKSNSRSTLKGIFDRKPQKSYVNGGKNITPNTVRDISFTDSKLGLGTYSQKTLPVDSKADAVYSFGLTEADGFVNSQSTYESYLQSRCLERIKCGEMDAADANTLFLSIRDKQKDDRRFLSQNDLTTFGKARTLSSNSYDNIVGDTQRNSRWKKFTLRFKRGQRIETLGSTGMYKTLPI